MHILESDCVFTKASTDGAISSTKDGNGEKKKTINIHVANLSTRDSVNVPVPYNFTPLAVLPILGLVAGIGLDHTLAVMQFL